MAFVIPVRLVINAGIFCSGFTKEVNSSMTVLPSKTKMDISVILEPLYPFPVVSMSTTVYNNYSIVFFKSAIVWVGFSAPKTKLPATKTFAPASINAFAL